MQNRPVVGTVHSERQSAPEIARHLAVESWVLRKSTRVIAVSEGVKSDLIARGIRRTKISVIHNGIHSPIPEMVGPWRDPLQDVVVVGRLAEAKNVHVAIAAIAKLRQRGVDLHLVAAGDGPELANLQRFAKQEKVDDLIEFAGYVTDIGMLLTAGCIFAMPSRSEGIPMSLLEAMARGMPIVATRVGGIPEVVIDRQHALLVQPDDATALADALETLVADKRLADRLAATARERFVERFLADRMTDRYQDIYLDLFPSLNENAVHSATNVSG